MAVDTAAFSEQTEIQRDITEMVRQFADEQIIPNAEHYDHEDSFPEPIVEQMKELGLFGITIPEETRARTSSTVFLTPWLETRSITFRGGSRSTGTSSAVCPTIAIPTSPIIGPMAQARLTRR